MHRTPDVWLDGEGTPRRRGRRRLGLRHLGVAGAAAACLAVTGVPVGLALTGGGPGPAALPPAHGHHRSPAPSGVATRQVMAALSATTSAGSFDMTYRFGAPTAPTAPTTTAPCPVRSAGGGRVCGGSADLGMSFSGQGVIDTDPFGMVASTQVGSFGVITVRDNGTDLWELGGGDYGLSPGSTTPIGSGDPISGFASLVEGTLGPGQGAFAMMGLASPTGYLDLDQSEITAADQTGTGTVDGTPVTVYRVTLAPAQQADVPGTNSVQAATITAALGVLAQQGYTGETVTVSVDASGYVRQTVGVAAFSDGSTITSEATFSDFGCAGTVLMPGQPGTATPPAGCVSPDTGLAPATTTTTTTPTTTTTAVPPPSVSSSIRG